MGGRGGMRKREEISHSCSSFQRTPEHHLLCTHTRDSQGRQCMVALLAGGLGPPLELKLMDEWKVQIHFTQKTSACTNTNYQVPVSAQIPLERRGSGDF